MVVVVLDQNLGRSPGVYHPWLKSRDHQLLDIVAVPHLHIIHHVHLSSE